jgi:nitroimidazol reductase NimA-like FMN-containing flavoprotein (pyridoxamine 5'-phosphate oxidase superfamily)
MFRDMRRKKQALSAAETIEILQSGTSGVLAVSGDNDYPYAVPLSYAYKDGKLFFHFAKEGHKIDAIAKNDRVSFCVIKTDHVVQKTVTTHFRSAIVFGRARILSEDGEKRIALECLLEKYSPDYVSEGRAAIERSWDRVNVAELKIEHMTGKAAIELVNQK